MIFTRPYCLYFYHISPKYLLNWEVQRLITTINFFQADFMEVLGW